MAYNLQMAQINTNLGGLSRSNTAWGFPVNTNFHTLLMSYWMCGPPAASGYSGNPGIWPAFFSAQFFGFGPGINSVVAGNPFICLTRHGAAAYTGFFSGNIPSPQPTTPPACLQHFLLSVDTHAQIIQVYVNDQPIPVTGIWDGTAAGLTPPFDFNVSNSINTWAWDVSGVIGSAVHPTLGDAWISNTPSFVDLSVVANRRKFISRELQPVDLGATGTMPFGYQPAMYMSIRPGGVATDILNNLGVGGGTWGYSGSSPPTFQTDGTCTVLARSFLDMDNVIATATLRPFVAGNQIFLDFSDDRGHSYGNPLGQPIGATGAYLTNVQWQRLGMARDRCFRLTWSVPVATALQGAWIEVTSAKS